jgi:DNA-binding MarR family transcriptional regulator
MNEDTDRSHRELLTAMMTLFRQLRCCSRDEAICRNVTFHQFVILDAVASSGRIGLAELHALLGVEKSTTTRLVDPLLRRGLLRRDRAEHDSRAASLAITPAGPDTHREVWSCLTGFFESIDRNLPPGKRAETMAAVAGFAEAIRLAAADRRCCQDVSERGKK